MKTLLKSQHMNALLAFLTFVLFVALTALSYYYAIASMSELPAELSLFDLVYFTPLNLLFILINLFIVIRTLAKWSDWTSQSAKALSLLFSLPVLLLFLYLFIMVFTY